MTGVQTCALPICILCDQCEASLELREGQSGTVEGSGSGSGSGLENRAKAIYQALRAEVQQDEQLARFHQLLHAHCIYCQLMREEGEEESHCHQDCLHAAKKSCDVVAYQQWRSRLKLARRDQCFWCRLSQSICTAIEDQQAYTYAHLMLPGLFFLH